MPSKKPLKKKSTKLTSKTLEGRPPIVAVLGHIDHGKTSLLDKIRQASVAAKEAGGITQHIGAYQVKHQNKLITFVDTPGHAAFSEMRSRGAKVADLVVLVVAADEGFKLQTGESLEHIKVAKIPYLVAINKVDLPNVNIDQVKKNLAKNGIEVEGEGGDIVAISVSAKTGKGIDTLLEMILLLAEMAELKGDPQKKLEAVVIESKLDRARGPLATILVRNGSLRIGDEIKVEKVGAKIRAMFDEGGERVEVASPSKPVGVLGFGEVPPIGGKVEKGKVEDEKGIEKKETKVKISAEKEEKKLKIILKTDVVGTLEAILASLPENVEVIFSGVGDVSESNVLLASASGAEIVGFRIKIPPRVKKLAQVEKVKIETHQVIYELLEEVEEGALKAMEPTIDEEVLGQAEILAEFEAKKQKVAGCQVSEGKITKKDKLHLKRGVKIIGDCRIKSMKRGKENISQAKKGEEFGAILEPSLDFELGDMLASYRPKVEEK